MGTCPPPSRQLLLQARVSPDSGTGKSLRTEPPGVTNPQEVIKYFLGLLDNLIFWPIVSLNVLCGLPLFRELEHNELSWSTGWELFIISLRECRCPQSRVWHTGDQSAFCTLYIKAYHLLMQTCHLCRSVRSHLQTSRWAAAGVLSRVLRCS